MHTVYIVLLQTLKNTRTLFKMYVIVKDQSSLHTCTSGLLQVGPHAVVVWEHGGCGSNFCSHVANGRHSCTNQNKTNLS